MNKQMEQPHVEFRDVSFYRGSRPIFDHLNLTIPRGKITAIMGPSGTGKTTLLRLMGAQLSPTEGDIIVEGQAIDTRHTDHIYAMRRRMGMLFQTGGLFSNLTVYENVAFPLREHTRLPETMIRDLVLLKLEAVGLRGAYKLMPSELSGGMARRVALARALILDPQLMLYDEPFVGQDPITMGVLVRLIKRMNTALKLTSIIVSHDVPETAAIADYIYLLAEGHVVGQGTPAEIARDTNPWVTQFMRGEAEGIAAFDYPAPAYAEDLLL